MFHFALSRTVVTGQIVVGFKVESQTKLLELPAFSQMIDFITLSTCRVASISVNS